MDGMNDIDDEQYSKRTGVSSDSDDLMVTGRQTFRSAPLHLPQEAFHAALYSHIQRSSSH
jgi:hypothetical protein